MLSDLVVCYLFLGGTGAGLCLVLSVLGLLVPRSCLSTPPGVHLHPSAAYRKLLGSGLVAAFVLLALGIVCLVADLGNAERMILLLVHPTASYLAVGSWALAACLALAAALGLAWLASASGTSPSYASFMWSPGLRPSWSWCTPAFCCRASARCPCGPRRGCRRCSRRRRCRAASRARLRLLRSRARHRRSAPCSGAWRPSMPRVIVVEAAIVAVFVYAASQAGAPLSNGTELAAAQSVRELVAGRNAQLFWGCFVVLGLAVPFALDVVLALRRRPLPGVVLFASACVLVGGFVMRFCVVAAGAHPVLSSMGVM